MKLNHHSKRWLQILVSALAFSSLTVSLAFWLKSEQDIGGSDPCGPSAGSRLDHDYCHVRTRLSRYRKSGPWLNNTGQLENDILYYVMVDRFADGDRGNNTPTIPDSIPPNPKQRQIEQRLSDASYDPNRRLFGLFFGGDLQGVRQRLPYLQSLGITKIILSPIQEGPAGFINERSANLYLDNGDGSNDKTGRSTLITNYHGYWLRDWFRIDPHFRRSGSDADDFSDLRQLLDEAKALGMGVLLDLTLHQASPHYLNPEGASGVNIRPFQNIFVSDSAIRRSGNVIASWSGSKSYGGNSWYEKSCGINYQRPTQSNLDRCQLSPGLPTLNHRNPVVEKYFLDAAEFWLTINPGGAQLEGFRIDAAKNLSPAFLRKLVQRVRRVNPKAILIAENFGIGSQSPETADLIRNVGDISLIDFDFTESARAYFSGDRSWFGHRSNLEIAANGYMRRKSLFDLLPSLLINPSGILNAVMPSNANAAKSWVTYLHEHDIPALRTLRPAMNDTQYSALIAFLMTARGVPMITWGGEAGISVPPLPRNHGFNGIGGDPFNRPMMLFPGDRGYHEGLANVTRRMTDLRRRYPVLRYGNTEFLRDRQSPFIGKTLLMLRVPGRDSQIQDRTSILYAFAPSGGRYVLNLTQYLDSKGSIRSCDVFSRICQTIRDPGHFQLELRPSEFRVLTLAPQRVK
jgi:glycosidase